MARPTDPQKRQAILQAARKIFVTDGYSAAKISEIATAAGVASGTVYLYFNSKEAIAAALAENFFKRVTELILEHVPQFGSSAGIEAYIDAVVQIAGEEKNALLQVRTDLSKTNDECSRTERLQLLKVMADSLEILMDQGKIKRYDPTALGNLIFGMLHNIVMSCIVFEDLPLSSHRLTATQLLTQALLETHIVSGDGSAP